MIPKVIHYCWLSNDPVPVLLQECMQTWEEKLPDYELMLWNFDRFDVNSCIWVKQAFEAKKYAFAADYIRLYAVYHHGGIYLDMDVKVLKSFDDLLRQPSFVGFEYQRFMEAAVFGAHRHAKWIRHMLDYYENRKFINKFGKMDITPLPIIMSNILHANYPIPQEIEGKCIRLDDLVILPHRYFMHNDPLIQPTNDTYTLHMFAGSWLSAAQRRKRKFLYFIGDKNTKRLSRLKQWIKKATKTYTNIK
jgi:mannosyltransferase OCH1-like enzyme